MREGITRGISRHRLLAGLLAAALALPAGASAQSPPPLTVPAISGFHSVLAQGEGQSVTATDLAAYQATGEPPARFIDQQPLYDGVMPVASRLEPADIGTYYKDSTFGSMPGGVGATSTPRPGVQIFRDARFGMAHIYGATRADVMFGAGYATAEERLFLMDAIRRTAKGTLAGLLGPSAAEGDSEQLTDQDFSDAELTAQFDSLDDRLGPEGAEAQADILAYVDGINARIDQVKANPTLLPAEYPALGATPERWTVADTAAMAVLLVTQFTVSNGGEEVAAEMRASFRKRFGKGWRAVYEDFRMADDPGTFTVAKEKFRSDRPGKIRKGPNLVPDPGSIEPRNTIVEGPGAAESAAARDSLPDWAESTVGLRDALPDEMSNAILVTNELSEGPRALAAMGPQVDYFSPQIFSEYELHGGGIDVSGVSFPGASPYPLIGHGIDFAWSGTSANGDNQDTFVERLCEPDGSAPTKASTSYLYKGECIPFTTRDQSVQTPVSPIDPTPSQRITYRTLRSVHGPVFAHATVKGDPVALTKAKGVDFHELDAVVPFQALAENQPTSVESFMKTMGDFPGTENWFYADEDRRRLHPVRPLPAPREGLRRRPALRRRRLGRLEELRPRRLHLQLDPGRPPAPGDQPRRRLHHLLEPEGGDRLAQGPDRVDRRPRPPRPAAPEEPARAGEGERRRGQPDRDHAGGEHRRDRGCEGQARLAVDEAGARRRHGRPWRRGTRRDHRGVAPLRSEPPRRRRRQRLRPLSRRRADGRLVAGAGPSPVPAGARQEALHRGRGPGDRARGLRLGLGEPCAEGSAERARQGVQGRELADLLRRPGHPARRQARASRGPQPLRRDAREHPRNRLREGRRSPGQPRPGPMDRPRHLRDRGAGDLRPDRAVNCWRRGYAAVPVAEPGDVSSGG